MNVNLADISVDPRSQCRGGAQLHGVKELAASIQRHGLLQAVLLQPGGRTTIPDGRSYRRIAGFRRFAAVELLRWTAIPAVVKDVDDDEARSIGLIENLARKELDVVEQARAMERQYPRGKYTLREIAQRLQRHTSWVQERWHLLKLPEEAQDLFASGRLPLNQLDVVRRSANIVEAARDAVRRKELRQGRTPETTPVRRRRKADVNRLIARLIDLGLEGLPTRVLAWANGYVSTDDLQNDIQQAATTSSSERFVRRRGGLGTTPVRDS